MFDLQVTYLRKSIPVRDLRTLATLKLAYPAKGVPTLVQVDGQESPFIVTNDRRLLVLRPTGTTSMLRGPASLTNVSGWNVVVHVASEEGEWAYPYGPDEVLDVVAVFQVTVDAASSVVAVRINGQTVGFTPVSSTMVLAEVPNVGALESFEVLSDSRTVGTDTIFEFQLGAPPALVQGLPKLTGQFLKVLLTRPKTDLARPKIGVGISSIIGTNVGEELAYGALPSVIQKVAQATVQIVTAQSTLTLPANERLISAQVVGMGIDPTDPTRVRASIQLMTLAGSQANFNTFLSALGV